MTQRTRDWIRYFVDYFALVVFLAAFFASGRNLQQATLWLIGGSAVAIVVGIAVERRLAPFPLIAGGAALVFGGLSLLFHDPRLLKIKPTVMNLVFAAVLLGGLAMRKHPLKLVLGDAFEMPDSAWRTLTLRYGLFFVALAVLNEIVWRTQSDSVWVVFRFPGLAILTVLFSLSQAPMLAKHLKTGEMPPPPTE
jgi:intracellular septation protein